MWRHALLCICARVLYCLASADPVMGTPPQLPSTHWHWHCNLPENDKAVLAMEAWIEWLQPFYRMTAKDGDAMREKADRGEVGSQNPKPQTLDPKP